jgi:hypothetical protein
LVVNFSLDEGDPRLVAIHWFSDAQLDGMRSLVLVARQQFRAGGLR